MKKEHVKVLPENEYLLNRFVNEIYGCPSSWSGGEGLIIKGYSGFRIKSEKEFMKESYKTEIIIENISDDMKRKLIYFATTRNLPLLKGLSEIEKITQEIKNSPLFRLNNKTYGARV